MDQVQSSFEASINRFGSYLPNLIGGIVVLVLGYLISRLVGSACSRLLARAGFDRTVSRHLRAGATSGRSPSATAGSAVFWLGMLVTLSLTAESLRLPMLAAGLNGILGFVPRVVVAAIIVGAAIAVGNVLADLVRGMGNIWLAKAVRISVIALAAFMALDQLGIARTVVATTFTALLGALAVAVAIAFGVGNIDLAREYTRQWASPRSERGRPSERRFVPPSAPEEQPGATSQTH